MASQSGHGSRRAIAAVGLVICVAAVYWAVTFAARDGSDMAHVPAGTFPMGSNENSVEKPIHHVSVGSFYIGKHEVTNRQFKKFVDANPAWANGRVDKKLVEGNYLEHWQGDTYPPDEADHPVVYVSWFAATAYCEWAGGRLPTEAECEYACRAGSTTKYCFGDSQAQLSDYGWFRDNSDGSTHPVREKLPNAWGIHDMHGNVWEWCSSVVKDYPYRRDDGREGTEDARSWRVLRGGSWHAKGSTCRSAFRFGLWPKRCSDLVGFRLVASSRP